MTETERELTGLNSGVARGGRGPAPPPPMAGQKKLK